MTLFQAGDFTLHSGAQSAWKIECDSLTDEDWETLALMVVERVDSFTSVWGVPRGGIKLAAALDRYRSDPIYCGGVLIVDDVLTTGASMEEARRVSSQGIVQGAVVFARGECPDWIIPLFQMKTK